MKRTIIDTIQHSEHWDNNKRKGKEESFEFTGPLFCPLDSLVPQSTPDPVCPDVDGVDFSEGI